MKSFNPVFILLLVLASFSFANTDAQSYRNDSELRLEDIMKGTEWTGVSPGSPEWMNDGSGFYFSWNPENELLDDEYKYLLSSGEISRLNDHEKKGRISNWSQVWDKTKSKFIYVKAGNLYLKTIEDDPMLLLDLNENILSPCFSNDGSSVFFTQSSNLFKYDLQNGVISKLTNFVKDAAKPERKLWTNDQEKWLYNDQMELFDVFKEREKTNEFRKERNEAVKNEERMAIPYGNSRVTSISISGDENYITFLLFNSDNTAKIAEMPQYVTETGFTGSREVRAKVGYSFGETQFGIFNVDKDTFLLADLSDLPGIYDHMLYGEEQVIEKKEEMKKVLISAPVWSPGGDKLVLSVMSADNKDRWIASVDLENAKLECIDHQRDEAWISGPGIGWSSSTGTLGWLPDNKTIYFQSEESGYSHLYSYDVTGNRKKALTEGEFEVYDPFLSNDKKSFYFTSNELHPGEKHFYRMSIKGGKRERLTDMTGQNLVSLSPDENTMVIMYSYATKPWELYLSSKLSGREWSKPEQITQSLSKEFRSYPWKEPEFIMVPASDGYSIPARIYRPDPSKRNGCGVVFVHGAGYLQNAHKGWSSYFREYMFHNFLVDNGYTVLDMDYRASSGYGRYWRTAIYRHMGGKDLSDNVDGAKYLVESEGCDSDKLGVYGGSYGGFITLMAQFTAPGVFRAGAALRPVTDWAHYNHGYTANILNTPVEDSLSYRRSSPIYFADGLRDHLIMCHGVVDDNVHFQDVVRLAQRLIELQKDNWEVAFYPVEPHGFREWTSWLDEYKRIYKLFEETLNR